MLYQPLLLLVAVCFHWHRDAGSGSHFDFMTILSGYNTPATPLLSLPVLLCLAVELHSVMSELGTNNATQDSASVLIRKGSQSLIVVRFWLTWLNLTHCANIPSCWAILSVRVEADAVNLARGLEVRQSAAESCWTHTSTAHSCSNGSLRYWI